jgi:hypothetical protein
MQGDQVGWVVVLIIVVVLAGGACIAYLQLVDKVPPELKGAFNMAKQRRRDYRSAQKRHEKRLAAARQHLSYLENPMGLRLGSAGGVTLYERWISTPEASGSLDRCQGDRRRRIFYISQPATYADSYGGFRRLLTSGPEEDNQHPRQRVHHH